MFVHTTVSIFSLQHFNDPNLNCFTFWGSADHCGGVQPGIPHPPGMGCIKGVWGAPGGACMALEVQCMAFLTCLSNKTKLNIQYAFKTSIESFRAMVGNHS